MASIFADMVWILNIAPEQRRVLQKAYLVREYIRIKLRGRYAKADLSIIIHVTF